jgi:hypothetical protein
MWKVRTKTVPGMIGALGLIKKGLDQNLQLLPGHPSVTELHITLMSPAHIIQCAGVNRFYLLLSSGLTRRPPPSNRREYIYIINNNNNNNSLPPPFSPSPRVLNCDSLRLPQDGRYP